ncbi:MAG: hypothetical protein IKO26_12465 [Paludibacteraceae bacterium]|nr:hypothetical protein [Paludibacteraceae bacterium]
MKTKNITSIALLVGGMWLCPSCDNYFDEKYMDNGDPQISVVKTYDYTLAAEDYKTIANNSTNKSYASSLDEAQQTDLFSAALAQVGENGYFNSEASADMYVPAFIYGKYPHLDPGSVFNVTYRTDDGTPAYLEFYNQTIRYELKAADYKAVYGDTETKYLTPENEAQAVLFLPMVDDNYLAGVKYAFAEKAGAPVKEKEMLYIYRDGVVWEPYTSAAPEVFVLPAEANGQAEKWLANTHPYAVKDQVAVLMVFDSNVKLYHATEYTFDGTAWHANTGIIEETMSFVLSKGWAANLSTYYRQAVAGEGNLGKITLHHYNLEEGITYIWRFDNLYGMRGSAYVSGPHYGEGWFVTPKIKLKNSTAPALSFDHAVNYGPTDESRYTQLTVWVSTDYTDDVKSATWTQLPWNEWDNEKSTGFPDANSWTFYNSGRMDLSAWNNQTVYIGFCYKTEAGQTCPTWEVKNILVNEPEKEEEN